MSALSSDRSGIAVVARATVTGGASSTAPADARAKFRYADPVTWSALRAVDQALASEPCAREGNGERTGVIFISSTGPAEVIAAVAASVREGYISPLRFAALNPASIAGAVCIVHGFRGPSLTLTTPVAAALPVSEALARRWLSRGVLDLVVLLISEASELLTTTQCILWARLSPRPDESHGLVVAGTT